MMDIYVPLFFSVKIQIYIRLGRNEVINSFKVFHTYIV